MIPIAVFVVLYREANIPVFLSITVVVQLYTCNASSMLTKNTKLYVILSQV